MHRDTGGSVKSPVEQLAQSPLLQIKSEKLCKPLASSRTSSHGKNSLENRLDSWKAIATYLNRDVRTVQRWEKEEGLPVRRHPHIKASSVYGLKTEIDQWRETRSLAVEWAAESESTWRAADTSGQLKRLILNLAAEIIAAQQKSRSSKGEPCPALIPNCSRSQSVFFVSFRLASAYDRSESVQSAVERDKSSCYFARGSAKCAI